MTGPRVAGLALAGGRSSRMGKDKAIQLLGGRPLLAWTLACLDASCQAVAVSAHPAGASAALARHLGRFVIADDPAHPQGPLAGVASGLALAKEEGFDLLYTLPCDTPLVTPGHLAVLARAITRARAAYAATPGLAQPLCALWSVDVADALRAHLDAGRHPSVRVFLAEIGARAAPFPEGGAFRNVNTLADLAALQAELGPGR